MIFSLSAFAPLTAPVVMTSDLFRVTATGAHFLKGMKMKPRDEQLLCDAILAAIAKFDPKPEEVEFILLDVWESWNDICEKVNDEAWCDRQQFSRELRKALADLRDNRAESYWTERNTFDDALGRKCDADAAMNAARALK